MFRNKYKIVLSKIDLDDELLLLNYDKYKNDLASSLDGSFSFVLYDKIENSYYCARDFLGIKSLYFTQINKKYYFAFNVSELLKLSNIIKKPNLKSMRSILYNRTIDYKDTMYEDIYRLPAGCFMTIKDGKENIERYWHPQKIKIDYKMTEEEASQKLKHIFSEIVFKYNFNLKKTGFEVSGGLDSSSIVSLLSQTVNPSNIDSYSMEFNGLNCDESDYVESILDEYPLHHQKISVEKLDYTNRYSLKNLYNLSPNWPITLTFAMSLPMFEKMKEDGKKIIITGQGGDHLFTGTKYVLYDLFIRFKFIELYKELKIISKPWSRIKSYIVKPLLGEKIVNFILFFSKERIKNLFLTKNNEIKEFTDQLNITNPSYKNDLDMVTSSANSTILDGNFFHCVEKYFDIELKHPFFEKELVEFALSLPPEMKYKNKKIKWILRKAMDGILPDKIRDREDKAEFSEIILQQIDAIDLNNLLNNPYIVKLGLIEQSLIDEYKKEYEENKVKYIVFLWTIINVEYWYKYNFEN